MKKYILAVAFVLACSATNARAGSILDGLTVDLNWLYGSETSTPYQSYNPATVASGFEFTACPAPSYACSGPGSPLGTALGSIPNNAISVDVSDTTDMIEFLGADNEDNTHFSPISSGNLNGFALSVDESSALALLGQYVYFTSVTVDSSSGNWTSITPSSTTDGIFGFTPTSIFLNFQGLPSGPTVDCSGFAANSPCLNPTGAPNDVVVSFTAEEVSAAPEPASMILVGTGLLLTGGFIRRRNTH